ncbi:MAG: putative Imidazolonepropionase [Nitrospira sp.]|jgi:imidazolonepropionase-like amidohydrolase|nr:putative Imidazolonepropionase [Nitrospira sp.]
MTVAIRQIRILDGLGHHLERGTLLIEGTRILAAGPELSIRIPKGVRRIDGRGLTVLPGLIDCHVHFCLGAEADVVASLEKESSSVTLLKAAELARRTLRAGFTTVRDVGFRDHAVFALKQAIEAGMTPGPRILAAGLAICMPGGHARFIGREAAGVEAVRAAVQDQLAAGAEVIKVIASGGVLTPGTSPDEAQMTIEELAAAVQIAMTQGRHVAAHAHGATGMKNALRAGVHSIEHATLMDDEAAEMMGRRGVYMVPTLSALATTAACPAGCGIPDSARSKARNMVKQHEKSFRAAVRRAVPIAFGTDAGTPFNHHGENAQELERMVALGMTPMEAIMTGTSAAARLLGLEHDIGTIEAGKQADLLFIEGNPMRNIALLLKQDRIAGVMQRGRFVAGALMEA